MELKGMNKKGTRVFNQLSTVKLLPNSKRSQAVTIIVIVAVIILVIIGVLVYMNFGSTYTAPTTTNNNPSPSSNNPIVINAPPMPSTPSANNPPSSSQTYNVDIANFAFSPATLTISKGDTVTWTNKDSTAHTVTTDSGNELDSGSLSNGKTYSHTFDSTGTYNYHCQFHPMMKASIIVQ